MAKAAGFGLFMDSGWDGFSSIRLSALNLPRRFCDTVGLWVQRPLATWQHVLTCQSLQMLKTGPGVSGSQAAVIIYMF